MTDPANVPPSPPFSGPGVSDEQKAAALPLHRLTEAVEAAHVELIEDGDAHELDHEQFACFLLPRLAAAGFRFEHTPVVTQAELDDANANGYHEGFIDGCEDSSYELRAQMKLIAENLRAGIYTERQAIQELERLAQ